MNDFNQRWRTLAQSAGSLFEGEEQELPFGLAARIMAGSRDTVAESWDDLVSAVGLRAVLFTSCLCLVSAGAAFSQWYEFRIERPALEQAVTNDLSWP